MKAAALLTIVVLATTLIARADFSYTTTNKITGGTMASMAGGINTPPTKQYLKGQKMKTDNGDTATILDFDAQTITTVNNKAKTISVRSFSDVAATTKQNDMSLKIDVKETGQQKTINGYNAKELIMTMDVDIPQMQQMGKMQMEMDMWLSGDVPGIGELRSFYKKNLERMPWAALSGGGNPAMQSAMVEMQRKLAEMNGVQVLSVMRMKQAGGAAAPAMPQMSSAQMAQMQAAMAKLQEMQKQGGPQAAAAAQAMARMGGMANGAPAGGASNALIEITVESSDFSTASIPDSVFAIPTGYQKVDAK
jgi:hypothetical protein